jgi:hypothetical protein
LEESYFLAFSCLLFPGLWIPLSVLFGFLSEQFCLEGSIGPVSSVSPKEEKINHCNSKTVSSQWFMQDEGWTSQGSVVSVMAVLTFRSFPSLHTSNSCCLQ